MNLVAERKDAVLASQTKSILRTVNDTDTCALGVRSEALCYEPTGAGLEVMQDGSWMGSTSHRDGELTSQSPHLAWSHTSHLLAATEPLDALAMAHQGTGESAQVHAECSTPA